jgi:hypothetical protein
MCEVNAGNKIGRHHFTSLQNITWKRKVACFLRQIFTVSQNFAANRRSLFLLTSALSAYQLLDAPEKKQTISTRNNTQEWTHSHMWVRCFKQRSFCAQRPSKKGDTNPCVEEEFGRVPVVRKKSKKTERITTSSFRCCKTHKCSSYSTKETNHPESQTTAACNRRESNTCSYEISGWELLQE